MKIALFTQKTEERLLIFVFFQSAVYFVNYLLALAGIPGYASHFLYPLIVVYALYTFLCVVNTHGKQALCVVVTTLILLMVSWVVQGNELYLMASIRVFILSETNQLISIVIPTLLLCIQGINVEKWLEKARIPSNLIILMQLMVFIGTTAMNKLSISEDYMSYSYGAMIPFFVCFYHRKRSIWQFCLVGIALALQVIAGCRGALITALAFTSVYVLFENKKLKASTLLSSILSIVAIVVLFNNFEAIVRYVDDALSMIGFSSRTLDKLLGETGDFLSGERGTLFDVGLTQVSAFGSGLFGDRKLLGTYAHNWIVEILMHFGYGVGLFIVVIILGLLVAACFTVKKKANNTVLAFQFATAGALICAKFMLSSSYLIDPGFVLSCLFLKNVVVNTSSKEG